jgi:hypothetical protein
LNGVIRTKLRYSYRMPCWIELFERNYDINTERRVELSYSNETKI